MTAQAIHEGGGGECASKSSYGGKEHWTRLVLGVVWGWRAGKEETDNGGIGCASGVRRQ